MNPTFPSKSAPSETKLRGGYYTPATIARFISEWVLPAGQRTLEPSAGDGAILKFLAGSSSPTAVEIDPGEADKARTSTGVNVIAGDFFEWIDESHLGSFDGVAGNPPYIRFGNWNSDSRDRAIDFMRGAGLNPSRLTNAWVPFVVASVLGVRMGGRVGLVVPAELLQVTYAKELRHFLEDECSHITVISFRDLVFPGVQQEVVLLLAERGESPSLIRAIELDSPEELSYLEIEQVEQAHPLASEEKWTQYYLSPDQIDTLRELTFCEGMTSFGEYADVNVGVVTGRNSFFCLTELEAAQYEIRDYTIPIVSRSNFIKSVIFSDQDLKRAEVSGGKTRLLSLKPDLDTEGHENLADYLRMGEADGVHLGYKCSIRKSWWSVPSVHIPDGFMLRQISTNLAVAANSANATSTDTVHRVFLRGNATMEQLAVAALNSLSFCSAELHGRSYGGGVLELEPKEALRIRIPNPELVTQDLITQVDQLLRANKSDEAVKLVNQELLLNRMQFSSSALADVEAAHERLLQRRLRRGGKQRK